MRNQFHSLVEGADLAPLLREVDSLCERRDFEGLVLLERMCRHAVERGKQLWPVAEHIVFRLVLEGPPEIAGPLVVPGSGRFAPGPLAEVAASAHRFSALAAHLPSPQAVEQVAAEAVVRGENLSADPVAQPHGWDVPLQLLGFEPPYRLAVYRKDHVDVQEPSIPAPATLLSPPAADPLNDDDLEQALLDLVRPWFEESGGRAHARVVEGRAVEAIGSLTRQEVAVREIGFTQALELMAWAASSGGVHGRRRGAAHGRFAAWWAVAEMCDLPWPPEPELLAKEGSDLSWLAFEHAGEQPSGWRLGLACSSEADGWACAVYAEDKIEADEPAAEAFEVGLATPRNGKD